MPTLSWKQRRLLLKVVTYLSSQSRTHKLPAPSLRRSASCGSMHKPIPVLTIEYANLSLGDARVLCGVRFSGLCASGPCYRTPGVEEGRTLPNVSLLTRKNEKIRPVWPFLLLCATSHSICSCPVQLLPCASYNRDADTRGPPGGFAFLGGTCMSSARRLGKGPRFIILVHPTLNLGFRV